MRFAARKLTGLMIPSAVIMLFTAQRYDVEEGLLYAVDKDGELHHRFDLVYGYEVLNLSDPGFLYVIDPADLTALQELYAPQEESVVGEEDCCIPDSGGS